MRRGNLTGVSGGAGGGAAAAAPATAAVGVPELLQENDLALEMLADTSAEELAELFADLGVQVKLKIQLRKAVKDAAIEGNLRKHAQLRQLDDYRWPASRVSQEPNFDDDGSSDEDGF